MSDEVRSGEADDRRPADTEAPPEGEIQADGSAAAPSLAPHTRVLIGLAVAALLVAIIVIRTVEGGGGSATVTEGMTSGAVASADPVVLFDDARAASSPIVLVFHSGSCPACEEASATLQSVMAEYEGRVVAIEAITSDPRALPLLARYSFQFSPTWVFVAADGDEADRFSGALTRADLSARIDALLAGAR